MIKYNDKEEVNKLIMENEMVIVYFTGMKCGACEVIKLKVEELLKTYPKIKSCEINGEESIDIAAKYDVFSLPVLILFIEGKESIRVGKNVDLLTLEKDISRYYNLMNSN